MKKTLRIGFAMGGGVSLGTFNGAALTQTLKLAVLRGNCTDVQVDCFSGASAGAMSLAVMLRGLVLQTPEELQKARLALTEEFGEEFLQLPEGSDRQRNLLAAQVVQAAQEDIWVRQISIERLLDEGATPGQELRHSAGLLNRATVEKIAHDAIRFDTETLDLSGKRLLADRVLFGCALNNLTPILMDARSEFTSNKLFFSSLAEGMTSWAHREMRVFDLMFGNVAVATLDDEKEHPSRWFRYRAGDFEANKTSDLRTRKAWSTIAATAVASGAFPGAFEPVVLTRHSFEFGYQDAENPGLWPVELAGRATHPFTYSDGGAFNNEPIRDCFRMCSFLDAKGGTEEFERWIVFVDPNVEEPATVFQLPLHRSRCLKDPGDLSLTDKRHVQRLQSLDRLLLFAGSLLGAVMNEARGIEGDKIFKTHKRFALRDGIRSVLADALGTQPAPSVMEALWTFIGEQLDSNRRNLLIPVGGLTPLAELRRVISEEKDLQPLLAGLTDPAACATGPHKALWLRALAFVAVDLVMDMTGKSREPILIAIAPDEPLPGGLMSGFGGFMSEEPGKFEVAQARYSAQMLLEAAGRIPEVATTKPEFTTQARALYEQDFRAKTPLLARRLAQVLDGSQNALLAALPDLLVSSIIRKALDEFVDKAFAEDRKHALKVEFCLIVPPEIEGVELEDRQRRVRDMKPALVDGERCLLTFATFRYARAEDGSCADSEWQGVHVDAKERVLPVAHQHRLLDGGFCAIALPDAALMQQALLHPNPRFVLTLRAEHAGQTLPASVWQEGLSAGVLALEERLYV